MDTDPGKAETGTPDRPAQVTPRAGLGRLARLMRKELYEVLRDRRTIITLVLMPILLYPLLSMAFQQFFLVNVAQDATETYRIGVVNEHARMIVYSYFLRGTEDVSGVACSVGLFSAPPNAQQVLAVAPLLVRATGVEPPPLPPPRYDATQKRLLPPPEVRFFPVPDLEQAVRDRRVNVAIRVQPVRRLPFSPDEDIAYDWQVMYDENSPMSREVLRYVERQLAAANARFLHDRLRHARVSQRATPVRLLRSSVVGVESQEPISLKAVIPLILILMTITGAVYPAIDLTAGERERGTLEILVAAPVPRMALLFAKYVSVVTVAVLTALVNLVMMTVTLQISGLGGLVFGDAGLSILLVLQIFGLLLLFAAFFSAVLLTLASFARSFKEAQAYLIPLMLVSLAPGLAGLLPGLKLAGVVSVLPLINIVLLGRDLLDGVANPALAAVVVGSTLLYAAAAIAGAARFFGAEAVLYSEQSGWADFFRRPSEVQPHATIAAALFCLALIFPLYFVLATSLGSLPAHLRPAGQVGGGLLLFVIVPLLSAFAGRVNLSTGFQVHAVPWYVYPAALILGVSLAPLLYELLVIMVEWNLTLLGREQEGHLAQLAKQVTGTPALIAVLTFAAIGIAEEWFFRGYLFRALRSTGSALTTIGGSAVLFGVFHAFTAFDRLLPSTLMGLVLGWIAWHTRSVLPGLLLHPAYNAVWITAASTSQTFAITADHFPLPWLAAAGGGAIIGWGLIGYAIHNEAKSDTACS